MNRILTMSALAVTLFAPPVLGDFHEPEIVPGGPISLQGLSLRTVEAVVGHVDELQDAMTYGSEVLAVGALQGFEGAHYEVLIGTCTLDPAHICRAQAMLTIDRGYIPGGGTYDNAVVRRVSAKATVKGELNDTTWFLIQTLANVPEDVRDFAQHGNSLTGASTQFISPYYSYFALQNTYCQTGPVALGCLGGARLSIRAATKYNGHVPNTTYTTDLVLIK